MKQTLNEYGRLIKFIGALVCTVLIGVLMWHKSNAPLTTTPTPQLTPTAVEAEVTLAPSEEVATATPAPKPTYSEKELFYMAAAIYNESGGDSCSNETRTLVGYVILNRVNDSRFPNTIKGVLEQKHQYGLFYLTGIKFADRHTLPQEQRAVNRAYRIAKQVLETKEIPIPASVSSSLYAGIITETL